MIQSKAIENFLSKVHDALGDMPITEKSNVIVELYGLIQNKVRFESKSISTVIQELGAPLQVAENIGLDRDYYKTRKPDRSVLVSIVRWITISMAIIAVLIFLAIGGLLWKFTPLVKFTPEGMSLFGGSIQMKGQSGVFECPLPDYQGDSPSKALPPKDNSIEA